MLKIDLHIHTIASRHAHNTILEYITQAKKLKMKVIGIADHGPDKDSSLTDNYYFRSLKRMPERINGIRVLKGAEANIIDIKGNIDLPDKVVNNLDYVIANLHDEAGYQDGGRLKNTQAIISAITSGKIDILSHPHNDRVFSFDKSKVYEAACEKGVLLELNISNLNERKIRKNTISDYREIVETVKRYKCKVIVNSDSHNIWELGDDSALMKIKKEIGLTDKMIINNYPKELFAKLNIK